MSDSCAETREMDRLQGAAQAAAGADILPPAPTLQPVRLTLEDIRTPPTEAFVLGRTIPLAKSSVIYGPSQIGKSAGIAQLAIATAAGAEKLWGLPLIAGGGSVLIFTAEDTLDDWKRKAAAVARVGGVDVERALERLYIIDHSEGVARLAESVYLRSAVESRRITRPTEEADAIIAAAREVGARLIINETTSRMVEDEDNANMSALQSALGRIARETGAAVLTSHHPTKVAAKENDSTPEAARGGGAFVANARNALALFPAEPGEAAPYIDRFPAEDLVVLHHRKATSSTRPEPPILLARLDGRYGAVLARPEDVGRSPEQLVVVNARLAVEREREATQLARLYDVVADSLRLGRVSPTRLRDKVTQIGIPKRELDDLIGRAVTRGVLLSEPYADGRGCSLCLGRDPRRRSEA